MIPTRICYSAATGESAVCSSCWADVKALMLYYFLQTLAIEIVSL